MYTKMDLKAITLAATVDKRHPPTSAPPTDCGSSSTLTVVVLEVGSELVTPCCTVLLCQESLGSLSLLCTLYIYSGKLLIRISFFNYMNQTMEELKFVEREYLEA